jgi:large subunit ribosomal protein L23
MKDILIKPIITEKTLKLSSEQNRYAFQVTLSATKPQIAQAVEKYFSVKVINVKTVSSPGETRRRLRSRKTYRTPDTKKAYVQLEKGQSIDLFQLKESK